MEITLGVSKSKYDTGENNFNMINVFFKVGLTNNIRPTL